MMGMKPEDVTRVELQHNGSAIVLAKVTPSSQGGAGGAWRVEQPVQAKADKRLSHGFNMLFNYTLSKAIVNNMTSLVNERHYRAVSPFDQKHVFRLGFTYDMPFQFAGGLARGGIE